MNPNTTDSSYCIDRDSQDPIGIRFYDSAPASSGMSSNEMCPQADSAATPEARLAAAVGGWVHEALRGEGLMVVERESPRALWYSTLTRASDHGDASGVANLIAVGERRGWL